MKAVYDLELPYDVAITTSDNDSFYIVFLFSSTQKAEYFHHILVFTREIDLKVLKEDSGKFTFIFESSNSPQALLIKTNRTLENNPSLNKILDKDYKEYSYLTFGYKEKEQLFYDQVNSYPLFLSYSQD